MTYTLKAFILLVCLVSINCSSLKKAPKLADLVKFNENKPIEKNQKSLLIGKISNFLDEKTESTTLPSVNATAEEKKTRGKRQIPFAGGMGVGYGAYDYNDYYGDYVSDYAYDYYDWVCAGDNVNSVSCQLCNILTSECCNPDVSPQCLLPDSCLNNPCLSGGTCITTRTLDNRPDFICVCLPGLTGKYCQIWTDYFVGADIFPAPIPLIQPVDPPVIASVQAPPQVIVQAPQQQYAAPQYAASQAPQAAPSYGYAAPAPQAAPQYAPQAPQAAPSYGYAAPAPQPAPQFAPQAPQAAPSYGYAAPAPQAAPQQAYRK